MSRRALLRLGLFQLGAGAISVLFLGVLNRVLRVEMGLDLLLVGVVLGGGHYLGALAAIPFGYYSDRHPIRGLYRNPSIIAGITAVLWRWPRLHLSSENWPREAGDSGSLPDSSSSWWKGSG